MVVQVSFKKPVFRNRDKREFLTMVVWDVGGEVVSRIHRFFVFFEQRKGRFMKEKVDL